MRMDKTCVSHRPWLHDPLPELKPAIGSRALARTHIQDLWMDLAVIRTSVARNISLSVVAARLLEYMRTKTRAGVIILGPTMWETCA